MNLLNQNYGGVHRTSNKMSLLSWITSPFGSISQYLQDQNYYFWQGSHQPVEYAIESIKGSMPAEVTFNDNLDRFNLAKNQLENYLIDCDNILRLLTDQGYPSIEPGRDKFIDRVKKITFRDPDGKENINLFNNLSNEICVYYLNELRKHN